jgi:integrase
MGVKKLPGVLGDKSQYQDKENGRTRYGAHSFRRFRATHLDLQGVPQTFVKSRMGHGKKSITEEYQKAKQETGKRREWRESSMRVIYELRRRPFLRKQHENGCRCESWRNN